MKALVITSLCMMLMMPALVVAQSAVPKAAAGGYGLDATKSGASVEGQAVPNTDKNLSELIGTIIAGVLSLVGTIFFVMMVYAGFLWMTARGKPDMVDKAKQVMTSAIIGAVVLAGSFVIVKFIIDTVG